MKITVLRETFTEKSTIGSLLLGEEFFCYTLEDPDRKLESGGVKVPGDTAIPRGVYDVSITFSNRFRRELPLLKGVPQYEGVRIHPGNNSADTEGCILVGSTKAVDFVGNSRSTFEKLLSRIESAYERGEAVTVEVK